MAVAKRQRRGKPTKIEQRKVQGLEWGPQVEQTALLASPVYTGQAQREEKKHIKRRTKTEPGTSLLFTSFGSAHPHTSRMYFLYLPIKLSYNTGPSVTSNFCCGKTEPWKLHIPQTTLLRMVCNLKLMNCLFLEFSI